MIGYDPIMLEFINIKEWLEQDNIDHFVILGEFTFKKKKVGGILLKKTFFLNVADNDLFYVCHLSNNDDFLPKQTYELKHLNHNIGKYLKHDKSKFNFVMIQNGLLIKNLKKNKQIYEIKYPKYAYTLTFINKEALEMSQIGILNLKQGSNDVFKVLQTKQGVSAFEDIYFNAKLSKALYGYSHTWDKAINPYLRLGEEFFKKSDNFTHGWTKYTIGKGKKNITKAKAIENIKQKIKDIDECFLHSGERNESSKRVFFRGMRGGYGHNAVGDKILIKNFTSVSTSSEQANIFKSGGHCCLFKITLERGIPMINMEATTKFKEEKEYLLPRNLIFTCSAIHMYQNSLITGYDIKVSKQDKDQFKVNSHCVEYPNCEIKVSKKQLSDFITSELDEEMKSENVILELSEINKSPSIPDNVDIIIKRINDKYTSLEVRYLGCLGVLRIKKKIKHQAKKTMKISIFGDMNVTDPKKYLEFYKVYERLLDQKIKEVTPSKTKKTNKICPPGSVLNQKTNRCNKVKAVKTVKAVKAVKAVKTVKASKTCPPGSVLNPKTNRCNKVKTPKKVKKPKGLELSKEPKLPEVPEVPKGPTGEAPKPAKVCPPGSVLNPKTNRCNKVKTPKKVKKPKKVMNVLDNLITINGHGSFSDQKIKVPEGYQVLIPHRNGLDIDYTTPDAGKDKLYEEDLYKKKYLNYRDGWKLYLPGDDINNLKIHTFQDGASCETIQSAHELQRELMEKCEGNHGYKNFCPLYCTENTGNGFTYLSYKSNRKIKIKACDDYELNDLFNGLRDSLSLIPKEHLSKISPKIDQPIVLIPFTCNAKSSNSQMNHFDHSNHKHLNTIYQELVRNR